MVVYGTGVERKNWLKVFKAHRRMLFKTLSEDSRFEMLKRLARRDYCLLERAKELGLTSAIASHYLCMLVELDVVDM